MGQRDAFSTPDVTKINQMYRCPNGGQPSIAEAKPPMTAHNNINELIGENEETTTQTAPISLSTGRPNRPNRPLLNILGNLIGNAIANQVGK